jgi:hypothetical protein
VCRDARQGGTSIDSLLEDARLAPCLAEAAFHNAVLTLALAGVEALQARTKHPKYRNFNNQKGSPCPACPSPLNARP